MSSPLLPDDAGTTCHLWIHNGQVVDTKGNVWSEVGSIARIAAADLGFGTGLQAEGIGPFSLSNYLTTTAGVGNVFNFGSSFWVTLVLSVPAVVSQYLLYHQGPYPSGNGWYLQTNDASGTLWPSGGSYGFFSDPMGGGANVAQVFSFGLSGTTSLYKSNLLSTKTQTGQGAPGTPSVPMYIGRLPTDNPSATSGNCWSGKLYELRVTTTTPTSSAMDALHNSLRNPDYAVLVSGAQQQGAASINQPSRFFGHFHMH